MRLIETSIDIAASVERVWEVLTRFDEYPDWNPFVTSIAGIPRQGERLQVRVHPPGRTAMAFKPKVTVSAPQHQLMWLGHLGLPGLFDGEHRFRLERKGKTCRFLQSEKFTGILVPLFGDGLFTDTKTGFDAMNAALKTRAEAV